ncbi:hypothetical protein BB559_004236 [Furculomyces boomerangus]|uniref:Cysteine-rich transmembrane CYSTM domain-containing protein n=2 Tax=Harpellales TaxID=61421 RepID=A0A2T9Y921_9FUNG|nr:hypothetical protein BB559_005374 [Furculomyces boomerangus]PVU91244.1 hypothetical protein BB559_004236 [Furculomyces boomerangus]PWA01939.1 hypothetical protein BB558_001958 [Smittium angustum]
MGYPENQNYAQGYGAPQQQYNPNMPPPAAYPNQGMPQQYPGQQQPYPNQQPQVVYVPQQKESSGGVGCCAGLCAALAICCCLDAIC